MALDAAVEHGAGLAGVGRRREFAIRTAIGAGRGRLAAMVLAESLTLALTGGAVGLGDKLGHAPGDVAGQRGDALEVRLVDLRPARPGWVAPRAR